MKCLLVEDIDAVSMTTKLMLKAIGYEVETASNGRSAVESIGQNPHEFDLIITDILMPQTDGLELLQYLNELKNEGVNLPPIICYSGGGGRSNTSSFRSYAETLCDNFLEKPFSQDELVSCVTAACEKMNHPMPEKKTET